MASNTTTCPNGAACSACHCCWPSASAARGSSISASNAPPTASRGPCSNAAARPRRHWRRRPKRRRSPDLRKCKVTARSTSPSLPRLTARFCPVTTTHKIAALGLALVLAAGAAPAPGAASVRLEDLTWTELKAAIEGGTKTIIVPVGGTEQSGPAVALGKHNARVQVLADRIAAALGHTLVAPVVAYVPEGNIDPPTGHMGVPGTLTISDATFKALLTSA